MNPAVKLIAGLAIVAIGAFTAFLTTPQRIAPEARFATLGGESFTTSDLRGKVTVVNFWATWCPDCVKEMPGMAERHLVGGVGIAGCLDALDASAQSRKRVYARAGHAPFPEEFGPLRVR